MVPTRIVRKLILTPVSGKCSMDDSVYFPPVVYYTPSHMLGNYSFIGFHFNQVQNSSAIAIFFLLLLHVSGRFAWKFGLKFLQVTVIMNSNFSKDMSITATKHRILLTFILQGSGPLSECFLVIVLCCKWCKTNMYCIRFHSLTWVTLKISDSSLLFLSI